MSIARLGAQSATVLASHRMGMSEGDSLLNECVHIGRSDFLVAQGANGIKSLVIRVQQQHVDWRPLWSVTRGN